MDTNDRAPEHGSVDAVDRLLGAQPAALRFIGRKERKYLLERHHIRAKLFNPGGSVLLTASALVDADRTEMYSGQVGSEAHLDLLESEQEIQNLLNAGLISVKDLLDILEWFDSFDALAASKYLDDPHVDTRPRKLKKPDIKQTESSDYRYFSPAEQEWLGELRSMNDYEPPETTKRRKVE